MESLPYGRVETFLEQGVAQRRANKSSSLWNAPTRLCARQVCAFA